MSEVGKFLSRKEHKVREGLKPETWNSKPETNRRAKPFIRRGTLHGWKEELRNPNKDRSNVRNSI